MAREETQSAIFALMAATLPVAIRKQVADTLVTPRLEGRAAFAAHVFGALLVLRALRRRQLSLWQRGVKNSVLDACNEVLANVIALPGIRDIVDGEVAKELVGMEKTMHGDGDPHAFVILPQEGLPAAEILRLAQGFQALELEEYGKSDSKKWGGVYHAPGGPLVELQNSMWGLYNNSNTLFEGVFPSIRKYEAELVSWVLHLVHCDASRGGGILSSGGTESVLLAALAYREQGRKRGIARPRVVAAITAHPAIKKACHYFGMELTSVPVDASTGFALTAATARRYLSSDVVCLYASAPTFPHGVIDRIEDLGRLADSWGIGLHVDNCLGGIVLSYMDRAGVTAPHQLWDYRAKGVTSMSTDIHKYGNASKGVSVVTFRDAALRRLTYVPSTDGCEGLYVTSTLQGSRGGAIIAQAWATMLYFGDEGYLESAKEIDKLHREYQELVTRIPGMRLLCPCHACIVPIVSDTHNIYSISSLMEGKGWNLFTGQMPPVLSICIGDRHGAIMESLEADLVACVRQLDGEPDYKPQGTAAVYGSMATTPSIILEEVVRKYVDMKLSVKAVASKL